LLLAAAGALTLGPDHSATKALTRASDHHDQGRDLWHARLALKTLRKDQREAIAAAVEG
jgi:hypothetical protein